MSNADFMVNTICSTSAELNSFLACDFHPAEQGHIEAQFYLGQMYAKKSKVYTKLCLCTYVLESECLTEQ
jgi:hypothetical protein